MPTTRVPFDLMPLVQPTSHRRRAGGGPRDQRRCRRCADRAAARSQAAALRIVCLAERPVRVENLRNRAVIGGRTQRLWAGGLSRRGRSALSAACLSARGQWRVSLWGRRSAVCRRQRASEADQSVL